MWNLSANVWHSACVRGIYCGIWTLKAVAAALLSGLTVTEFGSVWIGFSLCFSVLAYPWA